MKIDRFNRFFNISTRPRENVKSGFVDGVYFAVDAVYYRQSGAGKNSTVPVVREGCRLQFRTGCGRLAAACAEKRSAYVTSKSECRAESESAAESEPAAKPVPESTESESEPAAESVPEPAESEPESELPESESGAESEAAK